MKKRKILYVLLFLIMSFFFFKGEVYAADAYAKCWYSITSDGDKLSQQNPIKLYLEAKNGVVTKKFENYKINTNGYQNYASWTASFVRDVPFDAMKSANDSNKLSCPVVYYKIDISGQATFKYNMSVYRSDLPGDKDREKMELYKQDVSKEEISSNGSPTALSCPYYENKGTVPTLTINISNSGSVQLPSGFIKGSQFDDSVFTKCPTSLWICKPYGSGATTVETSEDKSAASGYCANRYHKLTHKSVDLAPSHQYDEDGNEVSGNGSISDIDIPTGDPMTCESLKNTDTYKIVKQVFRWIQIIAPIMLLVFGVLDFGKAVASGDNDAMKKAQGTFVKRVIIAAVIILLPIIMEILFSLLDGALGNDVSGCNIGE